MSCCKPPFFYTITFCSYVIQKEDSLNIVIQSVEMFVSSTKEHWCFTNLGSHGIRSQHIHLYGSNKVSYNNSLRCIFSLSIFSYISYIQDHLMFGKWFKLHVWKLISLLNSFIIYKIFKKSNQILKLYMHLYD